MNTIVIKDCTYKYIRRNEIDEVVEKLSAISPWDSMMEKGSFVCVPGHNGSGKSARTKLFIAF